ncbi:MAG: hypothetical protein RLZZ04_4089 [Cyanobacteriota bacterium]|jgi:hypothetical protein
MSDQNNRPIEFELDENNRLAIEKLALETEIEILTEEECQKIIGGASLEGASFLACNSPLEKASFLACNSPSFD